MSFPVGKYYYPNTSTFIQILPFKDDIIACLPRLKQYFGLFAVSADVGLFVTQTLMIWGVSSFHSRHMFPSDHAAQPIKTTGGAGGGRALDQSQCALLFLLVTSPPTSCHPSEGGTGRGGKPINTGATRRAPDEVVKLPCRRRELPCIKPAEKRNKKQLNTLKKIETQT